MHADIPLSKHTLLRDGDLQDTVTVGNELFWGNKCESEDLGAPLGARFNGVNLGDMAIVSLTFDSQVSIEPLQDDKYLLVQSTLAGTSRTQNGGQLVNTVPKDIAVIDPSLPTRITFEPGCAHLVVKISRELIETKLSQLLRQQIREDVVFELIPDRNEARHQGWLETVKYLCTYYDLPDQLASPNEHVLRSHLDMVGCTLLTSLQHNFAERLADDRFTAAPRHVRRACEYIDQQIKMNISMPDLCQVTDVTERTLQNGFKKHLGQTPSAFIRSRRLHHIHQALLNAQSHTNVSRIMWEFGVSNPGQWAKLYFKQYGCYPSETLKARIT